METTSFMCPHCKREHGVRKVSAWAPESDNIETLVQMEEADFYDTESLTMQKEAKEELEKEYGRPADFVVGPYSGWCLRAKAD